MKEVDLIQHYKTVYSQQGQDGILEKIFDTIGTTNKYFVEFGSSGEKLGGGNTPYLRERYGWDGLLIDYIENTYSNTRPIKDYPVKIHKMMASNVNDIFTRYNVPREMDFLSIDIDGQDFHVWHALDSERFYPRVVSIESNYDLFANLDLVMPYDEDWVWAGDYRFGATVTALLKLGAKKGYSLVSMAGADCIFIRNDILNGLSVNFKNINDVDELWLANLDVGGCPYTGSIQTHFTTCGFFRPSCYYLEKGPLQA